MTLTSFARPSADGWRYSLNRRTRREGGEWVIQKWNGKNLGRDWTGAYLWRRAGVLMNVRVPETNCTPEVTVELDGQKVSLDGEHIGYVFKDKYTYSPRAAGHGGRIARYHTQVTAWKAEDTNHRDIYKGLSSGPQNTRKYALAVLVANAKGLSRPVYFK